MSTDFDLENARSLVNLTCREPAFAEIAHEAFDEIVRLRHEIAGEQGTNAGLTVSERFFRERCEAIEAELAHAYAMVAELRNQRDALIAAPVDEF